MYFVDRDKIEQILVFMNDQLSMLNNHKQWETSIEKLGLERIGHTLIESVLDVGNSMIDGFIMRDPGSYEDIIDILLDETVIDEAMSNDLKKLIGERKGLVQEYTEIDHEELKRILGDVHSTLEHFPVHIRRYLENELGPVSAFKN
ncbi:DUF86 domain-containing protein [Rossellomorea aquimaris]|uniref:DUF86 domain-containing protein n=1 Tax=Rossellomorea aquimaris TaxID=189382 RepID=UPI001CD61378|nr:DUF86 domain-containing protein [Rossellomorea aquimaris]MCA1055545.1 DUF86 domain-containing protein [Rossellomorea aquimaris]